MFAANLHVVPGAFRYRQIVEFADLLERATKTVADEMLWRWIMVVQDWWRSYLLPLVEAEERQLLPLVSGAGFQRFSERSVEEHRQLEALVYDSNLPCRQRLAKLATLLKRHVEFETVEFAEIASDHS